MHKVWYCYKFTIYYSIPSWSVINQCLKLKGLKFLGDVYSY